MRKVLLFCQMSISVCKTSLSPEFQNRAAHGNRLLRWLPRKIPGANKRGWSRCTRGFKATWFQNAPAKELSIPTTTSIEQNHTKNPIKCKLIFLMLVPQWLTNSGANLGFCPRVCLVNPEMNMPVQPTPRGLFKRLIGVLFPGRTTTGRPQLISSRWRAPAIVSASELSAIRP